MNSFLTIVYMELDFAFGISLEHNNHLGQHLIKKQIK